MKILASWLRPKYHELFTYQSAIISILLLIVYPELRITYGKLIQTDTAFWALAMGMIFITGMILSIIHIFTDRKKHIIEKQLMGSFALGVNGLAGIAAGIEIFPMKWSILSFFPIWNLLTGVVLFYLMFVTENVVTDDNASPMEIVIATFSIIAFFTLSKYWFRYSWAMTFSFCMFFTSVMTFIASWSIKRYRSFLFYKVKPRS
jgi:hypothetical protein